MKWLISLHADGELSAAGESIGALLLWTVNGQLQDNLPTAGFSLRTGSFRMEISALESLMQELSFGMVIYYSSVDKESL